MEYQEFIASKESRVIESGFTYAPNLSPVLFPFQRKIVERALRVGRAAIFADTGLGKTLMQLEWAHHVYMETSRNVLILAPLCVAQQTCREAEKIGREVYYVRSQDDVRGCGIYITNYEMLDHFDLPEFGGIVLDESSILKHHTSKTRNKLIESCQGIPYRLSCTATPSPNDHMELGNQAEFLGVMSRVEMLAMYFTHDGGDTSKWRLKGHAGRLFWGWLASWCVYVRKPSDMGFDDAGYDLPSLEIHKHRIESGIAQEGMLFPMPEQTLQGRQKARRMTIGLRVQECADLVNASGDQWIVWCHLNDESRQLAASIPDAVAVEGADSIESKEARLEAFTDGDVRVLVTKPSIAGFGMNWQHCHNMAFVGLNDSWEQYYQAIRRCWRYGQKYPVDVHLFTTDVEDLVIANLERKQKQAEVMAVMMAKQMRGCFDE